MKQASGYSWMYEKMVAGAKKWGSFLSILAGVLAGVVGTEGLVAIFTSGGETPLWAGILTAVIGYSIAVVVVLDNTWKLDVVRSEGLVAQVGFAHLSRTIMYQLALRPSERQDARDFVKGILNEIETMKLSSPTIDGKVKKDYVEKFKDNPIYNPEEQWEDYRYRFRDGWDASEDEDDVYTDYGDDDWSSSDGEAVPAYVLRGAAAAGGFDRRGVWWSGGDGPPPETVDAPPPESAPPDAPLPAAAEPLPASTQAPPPSPKMKRRKARKKTPPKEALRRQESLGPGDQGPLNHVTLEKMMAAYEDACVDADK
jgi:uncharacterized membrane protein YeaQ/YmgE (transglycosylase-associated protein family)